MAGTPVRMIVTVVRATEGTFITRQQMFYHAGWELNLWTATRLTFHPTRQPGFLHVPNRSNRTRPRSTARVAAAISAFVMTGSRVRSVNSM